MVWCITTSVDRKKKKKKNYYYPWFKFVSTTAIIIVLMQVCTKTKKLGYTDKYSDVFKMVVDNSYFTFLGARVHVLHNFILYIYINFAIFACEASTCTIYCKHITKLNKK